MRFRGGQLLITTGAPSSLPLNGPNPTLNARYVFASPPDRLHHSIVWCASLRQQPLHPLTLHLLGRLRCCPETAPALCSQTSPPSPCTRPAACVVRHCQRKRSMAVRPQHMVGHMQRKHEGRHTLRPAIGPISATNIKAMGPSLPPISRRWAHLCHQYQGVGPISATNIKALGPLQLTHAL